MVRITITGKNPKLPDKLVRDSIHFYMSFLSKSKQLLKSIEIRVRHTNKIPKTWYGGTMWEGCDNHKPREFTLELHNEIGPYQGLSTIAHECVHIYQFARGDLKDLVRGAGAVSWRGKPYKGDFEKENTRLYWLAPWEIEAHGYEKALYKMFLRHRRGKKI